MRRAAIIVCGALALGASGGCVDDAPGTEDVPRDDSGAVIDGGRVGSQKIRVGDCFGSVDAAQLASVDVVPCDEPHAYEAYHEFEVDAAEWPGDELFEERASQSCLSRFDDFVGLAYAESVYEISYIWPTEDTWEALDDRRVLCLLAVPDGGVTTGSAEDSRR